MTRRGWRRPFRDIDEEFRFHIEGAVEDLVEAGWDTAAARRNVLEEFGDLERFRAECREIAGQRGAGEGHGEAVLKSLLRDMRVALRGLRKQPSFAVAAVATLALGIGATVVMFSVVEGVVLRPLPYPAPDRLIAVWPARNFNIAMVRHFHEAPSVESITGISRWSFTLTGDGQPERLGGVAVGPEYFDVFGVRPLHGRVFTEEERYYGRADVALLSHDFWKRRFGGDPAVVGRTLALEGHRETERRVIGVLPPGHEPPGGPVSVWVPLATAPGYTVAQDSSWYVNQTVARLSTGATVEQARTEVRQLAGRLREEFPGRFTEETVQTADVQPLLDVIVGDVRGGLVVMLGAVALVLLIACANVANLLLARAAQRRHDIALRAALGASRGRLLRQSLAESLVLALLGGGLGVGLACWRLGLVEAGTQSSLPRGAEISVSGPVLGFAILVSMASVVLFGLMPAVRGARKDVVDDLKGGRRASSGRGQHRLRRVLVASEVALAVVLVAGAGLLVRSFNHLYSTDPGFATDGVFAIEVAGSAAEFAERRGAVAALHREVQARLAAVPGVTHVGAIHLLPLTPDNWSFPYLAEGHQPGPDGNLQSANFRIVTPGYFRTMGIPVLQGRDVNDGDSGDGVAVGLVNQAMAEELWPGQDPLGKEIRLFGNQPFTVVGVVGNVRQFSLDRDALPEMYRPVTQFSSGSMHMLVRADGADVASLAPALRDAVWSAAPDVPIPFTGLVEGVVRDSVARARFFAVILAGFGGLALALGAVGVYGVTACTVSSRLPEFGVRIALGAAPESVARGAVLVGLRPVLIGVGFGLVTTLGVGRLLASLLYEVSPTDPVILVLVPVTLCVVAALAILIPARRAGRVDPVDVLRSE